MAMSAKDTLEGACHVLTPALRELVNYAPPSVRLAELQTNYVDGRLDLCVVHRLFEWHELADSNWKLSFRSRAAKALGAENVPNGRQLVVERRSFLARAARVKKAKPRKVR